ncbi:hypothetical protein HBH84_122200 [Parastagonospora nodorum]|nr:hypothetical protein HBH84_122200 [Parastagonospora nodorum]
MEKMPDLDTIDPKYMLSPFSHTLLGRLPIELLEIVTVHLHRRDLAAVAHINPVLRALAERQLYRSLQSLSQQDDTNGDSRFLGYYRGRGGTRGGRRGHHTRLRQRSKALYMLYKTLSSRLDLCGIVKTASLDVVDRNIAVSIPFTSVFPGGLPFTSNLDMTLPEPTVAGALIQQIHSLKRLSLRLYEAAPNSSDEHAYFMPQCLRALFPRFSSRDTHCAPFTGLQKLKTLDWSGREFLWILAKSPYLLELRLSSSCQVLPDKSPHETKESLQFLRYVSRSSIFSHGVHYSEYLQPFLAHFTSLQRLELIIDDSNVNEASGQDISFQKEGILSILLQKA